MYTQDLSTALQDNFKAKGKKRKKNSELYSVWYAY